MAQHRPIAERMQELQAQMVALQVKQNKEVIKSDPRVMEVDSKIAELNKDALKWKRWEKEADQKAKDFEARKNEWIARGERAESWLTQYKEDLSRLTTERNTIAEEVASEL